MGEFLNSVSAVFVIFLILAVGYLLGHLGWLTSNEKGFISKYVVNIAVPVNCVVGVLEHFTRDDLLNAGIPFLVALLVVGISLLLSAMVANGLHLPQNRWGIFVAMAGISNTMFIGMPMTQQLFGAPSLPYMMTYFLASTMYTQTVAVMLCERAGGIKGSQKFRIHTMLLSVFQKPPIIGIFVSIFLLLTNLRPPQVLMSAAGYISNTVTPLALIYCGFILYEVGIRNLRFLPGIPMMLIIRLIVAPALCCVLCLVFGVTGLTRDVFIIMSALPTVTQVTVMAGAYGADEQYSAVGSCLSLLGIFVTIPVIMMIL